MSDPCPKCGADLRGDEIPQEVRHYYGETTHYSRRVGYEDPEYYDGICAWWCPDCGHYWKAGEWVDDEQLAKLKKVVVRSDDGS